MSFLPAGAVYAILDTGYVSKDNWVAVCRKLLDGGADVMQLRAKRESHQEREELLKLILPLFQGSSVPLIINDDIDLALKYPNLGLHIGQEDISVNVAREELGKGRILGLSTHSLAQAQGAIDKTHLLNYFAVGPIFSTATKPNYIPVGLELIEKVVALEPELPFVCIGGINRKSLSSVREVGGQRVVMVSALLKSVDIASEIAWVKQVLS